MTFYSCDTVAHRYGRTLPERLQGRGGTVLERGIEMAIADGARCVVVITDCGNDWDTEAAANYPVPVIIGANRGAARVLRDYPEYRQPEPMIIVPVVPEP